MLDRKLGRSPHLPDKIGDWRLEPELDSPVPRKIVRKRSLVKSYFRILSWNLLLWAVLLFFDWLPPGRVSFFSMQFSLQCFCGTPEGTRFPKS